MTRSAWAIKGKPRRRKKRTKPFWTHNSEEQLSNLSLSLSPNENDVDLCARATEFIYFFSCFSLFSLFLSFGFCTFFFLLLLSICLVFQVKAGILFVALHFIRCLSYAHLFGWLNHSLELELIQNIQLSKRTLTSNLTSSDNIHW